LGYKENFYKLNSLGVLISYSIVFNNAADYRRRNLRVFAGALDELSGHSEASCLIILRRI